MARRVEIEFLDFITRSFVVLSFSVTRSPQIALHPPEIREREYVKRKKRSERGRSAASQTSAFSRANLNCVDLAANASTPLKSSVLTHVLRMSMNRAAHFECQDLLRFRQRALGACGCIVCTEMNYQKLVSGRTLEHTRTGAHTLSHTGAFLVF